MAGHSGTEKTIYMQKISWKKVFKMTFNSYVEHLDDSFTHPDKQQNIFGHYRPHPTCLNLFHPLDY